MYYICDLEYKDSHTYPGFQSRCQKIHKNLSTYTKFSGATKSDSCLSFRKKCIRRTQRIRSKYTSIETSIESTGQSNH